MNAEFKKGGKYALTGPSGCGKSTLLKILLGWLPGYQGKVLYDERDVRDYTPEQLQQKMSYIEQNVFLFNTTIRENITLGEHFTDEQMERHCVTAPGRRPCQYAQGSGYAGGRGRQRPRAARSSAWPSPVL